MNYDSKELIMGLKSGNNDIYRSLYNEYYPFVKRFVINNSGGSDDAKDIFQDTLIVLLKKIEEKDFELTASLKTYVIAISKNLWFKKLRSISYQNETTLTENLSDNFLCEIDAAVLKEKSYWEKLQEYFTKISSHCNRLLHSMFFKNKTIEDIQMEYGYSTKHNAQNQKHKCLQQMRKASQML